ncbi:hypothetical protein Leryth_024765, partial [Lithospermum erythrorhizon]
GEVKYRGVRPRKWGKYSTEIRDVDNGGARVWLGTYDTAIQAARSYDMAAYAKRGHFAILNFPEEYNLPPTSSHFYSSSSLSSSSASEKDGKELFEFEYLDDSVLDELLDNYGERNKKNGGK